MALALAVPPGDATLEKLAALARALPEKPDHWIELGRAWIQRARRTGDSGQYLNADACATQALRRAPAFRPALDLRLLVLLNAHRFAEARDQARALLARVPDDALAAGALSDALLELGDLAGAREAAQRMMDLKPDLPSYSRTSYLRWLQGDIEGAKEMIRGAYDAGRGSRDPEPAAWALVQAALIFWHAGDYEGALAGLDLAEGLAPGYPAALQLRGRCLISLGRFADAIAPLKASLDRSPLPETAWLLADAQRASGDAAGATASDERVKTLGRQMDQRTLAQFLAARNVDAEAAVVAARAESTHRGGPYIDDALAFALFRRNGPGDLAEATTLIRRALESPIPDARLRFHAGAILLAAGQKADGQAHLKAALKLNPAFDHDGVAEARALLGGRR